MIPVLIAILAVVGLPCRLRAGAIQRARRAAKLHPRIVERRGRGIEAPLRPHPEPRGRGQGLRRARTRGAGARDRTAQPLRRQQRPGGRPVPRRSPARGRAEATARGGGKLSAAQGRPEFSQAANGTGQHRGPHPGRAPVLQRQRARLPQQMRNLSRATSWRRCSASNRKAISSACRRRSATCRTWILRRRDR